MQIKLNSALLSITGGEIISSDGLAEAYTTGRGSVLVRGKVHVEDGSGKKKPLIVITELPFQTNKVINASILIHRLFSKDAPVF